MHFSVCVGGGGCINRLIVYYTVGLVLIILGTTSVSFFLTPITINQIKTMLTVHSITPTLSKIFFYPMPPHVLVAWSSLLGMAGV